MVVAAGAFVAGAERSLASMAVLVNADAYWLFYPVDIALERVPLTRLDLYTIIGTESPGTILVHLGSWYFGCIFIVREIPSSHLRQRLGAEVEMSVCRE